MENRQQNIPESWTHTSLEHVCQILDSMRIPVNNSERSKRIKGKSDNELYPYYGATGQVGVIDGYIFDGEHVLLGEDGAPFLDPVKEKAYLASGKYWVNNHAHILKALTSNKFLCHFLNQVDYSEHVTGTTRLKLTQAALKQIPIRLAPENEQHRIIAKIEELFSELDKGIESLKTAREQLKLYRQAVLKHAFEGKLTEQWREENKDKLETADQLLARIKQERESRYQQQLEEWKSAVKAWEAEGKPGKKPTKPKRPRKLSSIASEPDDFGLWPQFELGDVISVSSGRGLTANDMRGGNHLVYGGNGVCGYHDTYFIEKPTLIIGRVGAKCGVTHITKEQSWVTDNALIVSPVIITFEQRFFRTLLEFLNLNRLGSSTGQPVISGSKIYPVLILLPSYEEQIEIADRLDRLQTSIDATCAEIEIQITRSEALRQSTKARTACWRICSTGNKPSIRCRCLGLASRGGQF